MEYPVDPGGNFASDYHRRVLAHIAVPEDDPMPFERVISRLEEDALEGNNKLASVDQVQEILDELRDSGLLEASDNEYRMTSEGFDLLQANIAGDTSGEEASEDE